MEYLGPSKCRTLEVTDTLKLSNVDVGAAITNLQSGFGNLTTTDVTLKNVTCTSLASSGTVSCGVSPTALGHLTPKAYVDGISYLQAGAGLSKNFSSLSVNAAQPGITSVGTLTSLTTGAITGTSATFSSAISVGTPTATGHATNKSYVDGIGYITAGAGLTKTSGTLSVNPTQTQITAVGTLSSLTVSGSVTSSSFQVNTGSLSSSGGGLFLLGAGASNYLSLKPYNAGAVEFLMTGSVTILKRSDGATSLYVDNVTGGITIDNAFGISATGTIQGLNQFKFSQLANINTTVISATQWGYLGALNQNVHTTSSPTFAGLTASGPITVGAPTLAGHATSKTYVDGLISPIQASLTALGTSITSYELTLSGSANITGYVSCNRVAVSATTPTHSTHLTSKLYVDSVVVTASGNLTKTGTNITLNPSITLTDVTCSGTVTAAAPTVSGHLTTKGYVDNAITTANASVSTGTFTTGTFSVSGLTFVGLSKSVRWSKVGAACIVSAEFTWTSTTGTLTEADGNTTITTPFNSPIVRSMNVVIQKDSFVTTRMSYMDEASPALKTRVNAADMPGYASGATLLVSWIFYT